MTYDAIVLAGGDSMRMGVDKLDLVVAGRTILQRVVDACVGAERIVVVGPKRASVSALWVVEEPPGAGPATALAAGLHEVDEPVAVVLAGDLPLIDRSAVDRLVAAADRDGVVAVDDGGHRQYLAGAYRTEPLRKRLRAFPDLAGVAVRSVAGGLDLVEVPAGRWALDVDEPSDLAKIQGVGLPPR